MNKIVLFILTKLFKKYITQLIPQLVTQDNLVKFKLDNDTYKRIEEKVGLIRGNNVSEHEYAYMLGQQSVLKVLRDDYVR